MCILQISFLWFADDTKGANSILHSYILEIMKQRVISLYNQHIREQLVKMSHKTERFTQKKVKVIIVFVFQSVFMNMRM